MRCILLVVDVKLSAFSKESRYNVFVLFINDLSAAGTADSLFALKVFRRVSKRECPDEQISKQWYKALNPRENCLFPSASKLKSATILQTFLLTRSQSYPGAHHPPLFFFVNRGAAAAGVVVRFSHCESGRR